ncbi:deoxyribonuclease tatdn1 [Hordeum vulgare]|nr:deoxyribonuclease tatdn1 [Hordeum vulgare]
MSRSYNQSFPWSNTTCNESRDGAFKKGTSFTIPDPIGDRKVFTPVNTLCHRRPHPRYHAIHTTMAIGQHQATGSVHEHLATTTKAAASTSNTLTPPHPRSAATPTKETSDKDANNDEESDIIASFKIKGEMIFKSLYKNKLACSNFLEIMSIAIEGKKYTEELEAHLEEHEATVETMEGHERDYANEIAELSQAL